MSIASCAARSRAISSAVKALMWTLAIVEVEIFCSKNRDHRSPLPVEDATETHLKG
jgi:hypothetical protein